MTTYLFGEVQSQAAQAHTARSYSFNMYANVQREKRDIFTIDIYYNITTEFGYAKRDLRPAAYGGVVLQRFEFIKVCMGKTVIHIVAEILIF